MYPHHEIREPSRPSDYRDRLVELFPDHEAELDRYFYDIRSAARWMSMVFARGIAPKAVSPFLGLWARLRARLATETTAQYLDEHVSSVELRAILASQWGDYGLPPERSAFGVHALIVDHYLHGAWFPEGGSGRIARTFERGIERAGGCVRVAQDVQSIVVRGGRAVGVRVLDRRGAVPREIVHEAPVIISDVGASNTYHQLLPTSGPIGARTARVRRQLASLPRGLSAVILHVRLGRSARDLGVAGENLWVNAGYFHDDIEVTTERLLRGDPRHVFVSFPSLRSGDDTFHTAEVLTTVSPEPFRKWRERPQGNRGSDYEQLKRVITAGLLRSADKALPGFADAVTYAELSTPLTMQHYTSHPDGQCYGVAASPQRYRTRPLGPDTPIKGLWLAGTDAGSLGIVGAMFGGVAAASRALGARGYPAIAAVVSKGPRPTDGNFNVNGDGHGDKIRGVLLDKQRLAPHVWQVRFELAKPIDAFVAGQYARIQVAPYEWRAYSIAAVEGRQATFLIATTTGGEGSRYFDSVEPGTVTLLEAPLGRYKLAETTNKRVFIATGTGLAPFASMFEQLAASGSLSEASLYFGYRHEDEDLTGALRDLPATVVRCVSGPNPPPGGYPGRVTDALAAADLDWGLTDFHVCGSAAMVADVVRILEERGATHIHTEPY